MSRKNTMNDIHGRLKNILQHEKVTGYENRAVIGGLDLLLQKIKPKISWLDSVPPRLEKSYASLSPDNRHIWIQNIIHRLMNNENANQKHSKTSSIVNKKKALPGNINLDSPLGMAKGLTRQTIVKLQKIGLKTIRDMIFMFPYRHVDYSRSTPINQIIEGNETTVFGRIITADRIKIGRGGAAKIIISDGSGKLNVTFFGQPYLVDQLKPGRQIALSGHVKIFRNQLQMDSPEYQILSQEKNSKQLIHAGNILPVYHSTEGLPQRTVRNAMTKVLPTGLSRLKDPFPRDFLHRKKLVELTTAVSNIHFPGSMKRLAEARRRLAFNELMFNQLLVQRKKSEWKIQKGHIVKNSWQYLEYFHKNLPFELTEDQKKVMDKIFLDMSSGIPMGRLLQGEVGSGKTIVAVSALLSCVASDLRGAFLAPTEVLAEQHFMNVSTQLGAEQSPIFPSTVKHAIVPGIRSEPLTLGILTGSITERHKTKMRELINAGAIDLVIGTHALLQEDLKIPKLGLAVIDEQHRFGVEQRATLQQRTPRPHVLAMSATPIPRTLALTVYGDLDLSTLRQMPPGRKPSSTTWIQNPMETAEVYELIESEVKKGRQGFVVCPLIDESDSIESKAASTEFERLSCGPLANMRIGLLHGRMSLSEKQNIMENFRKKKIDVLVATQVIEVGLDIPNATVMIIESADRFGMAQLHQLRGRVGRGKYPGMCFLFSDHPSDDAMERLAAVEHIADGFKLAEEDLRIRGPGEYIVGTQQSGWNRLNVAKPSDLDLIEECRQEAQQLLKDDPSLNSKKYTILRKTLEEFGKNMPAEIL